MNLKDSAKQLKIDIPAVFIALGHKNTPFPAKLLAAPIVLIWVLVIFVIVKAIWGK